MAQILNPNDWLTDARSMAAEAIQPTDDALKPVADALQSIAYSLIGLLELGILARAESGEGKAFVPPF